MTGRALLCVLLVACGQQAAAQLPCELVGDELCPPPATGPDVIVGDLVGISRYGTIDGISSYSIGTTSCNIGDEVLSWDADSPLHPVIGQHLYRLKDGRFEQLGISWVKHGFAALTGNVCCTCQNPNNSQFLGQGCSDPYSSTRNGDQDGTGCCGGLGPRYQVNATNGAISFPYDTLGVAGDALYKRLQVRIEDLDPALNSGAKYYGEGQYVTADDAAAANHHNNASYKRVIVGTFQNDSWILLFNGGDIVKGCPAIYAWQAEDPEVVIEVIEDDNDSLDDHDGRFYLGYRVSDNGDGTWHYEYALYNMNSHRSAKRFTVPVTPGVTVTNVGFHDVDYHSGDGFDGINNDPDDWEFIDDCSEVSWKTDDWGANLRANALRWGTLYNFRFDADAPPVPVTGSITLYRPSPIPQVLFSTVGPGPSIDPCPWDTDGDDIVGITEFLEILGLWGEPACGPPDSDGDGFVSIGDFLLVIGNWGACPTFAGCVPNAGNCYASNGSPGCADQGCCETVCAVDLQCCTTEWDAGCQDLAFTLCGNCGAPEAGDCCAANFTPGCNDDACCRAVCEVDPVCCNSAWDAICVLEAETHCGCP